MVVKTFRGLLASGGQEKIRLTTTDGRTAYRIVKFEIMSSTLATADQVAIVKITKKTYTQTSTIDFSDNDILAAGILRVGNLVNETMTQVTVFETEIFNQDIYINLKNLDALLSVNYYIELEQITLTAIQAETLIVKDLRGEMWTRPTV